MNTTKVLRFPSYTTRQVKIYWKQVNKRTVKVKEIPEEVLSLKKPIVEATEYLKESSTDKNIQIPEPYRPKTLQDHPDYKNKPVYLLNAETKITEGLPQLQVLLKALIYSGLPNGVASLIGKCEIPKQDEIFKKNLLSDFVYDATQKKLTRKVDPAKLHHTFPRDFGIPLLRKKKNFSDTISYMGALATAGKGSLDNARSKWILAPVRTLVEKEDDQFYFDFEPEYCIAGSKPLNPFGSARDTTDVDLPDIYPLYHTVELSQTNMYKDFDVHILPENHSNSFAHVIGVIHTVEKNWGFEQKMVNGISNCFATALLQARRKFGLKVGDLPEPICLHAIHSDDCNISIISFQLNTTNINGKEGIKNQVWLDGPHQLFESCIENDPDKVIKYNPEVLPRIIATFANGLM